MTQPAPKVNSLVKLLYIILIVSMFGFFAYMIWSGDLMDGQQETNNNYGGLEAPNFIKIPSPEMVWSDTFTVLGLSKNISFSSMQADDINSLWNQLYADQGLNTTLAQAGINTKQVYAVYHDYRDSMGVVDVTVGYLVPKVDAKRWAASSGYRYIDVKAGQYQVDNTPGNDVLSTWSTIFHELTERHRYHFDTDFDLYQLDDNGKTLHQQVYIGVKSHDK